MRSDGHTQREFDADYERLFKAARTVVTNFFRFDPSAVANAVEETMARTFERWERVRRHENRVAWVVACAKDVCLDQLRMDARRGGGQREPWETLGRLSKFQRDVAVLRFMMECDEATTADALRTTVPTVRATSFEVVQRLRVLLRDLHQEPAQAAV